MLIVPNSMNIYDLDECKIKKNKRTNQLFYDLFCFLPKISYLYTRFLLLTKESKHDEITDSSVDNGAGNGCQRQCTRARIEGETFGTYLV